MVDKNKAGFAERQLARAKKACNCQGIGAHPSVQDCKAAVSSNKIKDCPITEADTKIAQKVYGPNLAKVKRSQVRIKSIPFMENCVSVPKNVLKTQKCAMLTANAFYQQNAISPHPHQKFMLPHMQVFGELHWNTIA